jgi:non-canonical (house-cleaning) NTP pyrophosphatase
MCAMFTANKVSTLYLTSCNPDKLTVARIVAARHCGPCCDVICVNVDDPTRPSQPRGIPQTKKAASQRQEKLANKLIDPSVATLTIENGFAKADDCVCGHCLLDVSVVILSMHNTPHRTSISPGRRFKRELEFDIPKLIAALHPPRITQMRDAIDRLDMFIPCAVKSSYTECPHSHLG